MEITYSVYTPAPSVLLSLSFSPTWPNDVQFSLEKQNKLVIIEQLTVSKMYSKWIKSGD